MARCARASPSPSLPPVSRDQMLMSPVMSPLARRGPRLVVELARSVMLRRCCLNLARYWHC